MSTQLSEVLLPALRRAFPDQRMRTGPQAHILATFDSPHPEVGCVAIQDDGDEFTLFLGDRTHLHIGSTNESLAGQARAEHVTERVIEFLRKLFADQIEFYGVGVAGGCHERGTSSRGILSRILLGRKSFVWSGPLT